MVRSLGCSKCNRTVENVGDLAVKVTCSYCTMMMTGLPEETKRKVSTGRPAGWHFMNEFVDKDGNVFHKGKEQPKLFGTLKSTKVVVKKKVKRRTANQILVAREAEKKAVLKKAVKKQKDFINHNFGV
jgi:phage FluMu protein Com